MKPSSVDSPEKRDASRRERYAREHSSESDENKISRDLGSRGTKRRSSSKDEPRSKRRRSVSSDDSHRSPRDDDKYPYGADESSFRSRYFGPSSQNYPFGFQGRGGFSDPLELDYLISPAQFADYIVSKSRRKGSRGMAGINQAEIERRYLIYRENFMNRQQEILFNLEKDSEWVRERYHPTESKPLKEEVNRRRHELLAEFEEALENGKYDDVTYDEVDSQKLSSQEKGDISIPKRESDVPDELERKQIPTDYDTLNDDASPKYETMTNTFFIRAVSPSIKRSDIVELCKKIEGFKYLCLSDPKPEKNMHRLGWVVFDKNTDMKIAFNELDGKTIDNFTFHIQLHRDMSQRTRYVPSEANIPMRLEKDLEQIRELAKVLGEEVGIPNDSITEKIENRAKMIQSKNLENNEDSMEIETEKDESNPQVALVKITLDLYITYLRFVHQYDYYGGVECISPEDFYRKSFIHLRKPASDKFFKKGWMEQLDYRTGIRITKPTTGPEMVKLGGKCVDVELEKSLSKHIKREDGGNCRCKECSKLFRADEFVRKHIKLKHPDIVNNIVTDIDYFNNFVRDQQRSEATKLFLSAGGNIMNLTSSRIQSLRASMMNGVDGGLPGITPMMLEQMPRMGKNFNFAAWNMLLMCLSKFRNGVVPKQMPQMSGLHSGMSHGTQDQGDPQRRDPRRNKDFRGRYGRGERNIVDYRDLDDVGSVRDLKVSYD